MLETQWGGYVAFRAGHDSVEVLRDPSGEIPCYHAEAEGVRFVTSRPNLLFSAGLLKPEIDWTILTQALAYVDLRPARTALRGVDELLPGMLAIFSGKNASLRSAWSPWRFAGQEVQIEDRTEAIALVRDVVTSCLTAWSKCFRSPIVEISGGLDSAIVATVLAQSGSTANGITVSPGRGDPDELPYARAIAEQCGISLRAFQLRIKDVDLRHSGARDLPRPTAHGFLQAMDTPAAAYATRLGADAFLSGGGGDNVFCNLQSALPVLDRASTGDIAGAARTIGDIAQMAEVSMSQVLSTATRRALSRRRSKWPMSADFLSPEAIGDLPFPAGHPWIDQPRRIPSGKAAHVRLLLAVQNHLEGLDRLRCAPIISPLLSQPVMEACLTIPTWLWCDAGNNRAMARAAFADRLPQVVVERRSKGRFDAFVARLVEANRATLLEMLLDGVLAAQSIVDRDLIAASLEQPLLSGEMAIRLLTLADAEAWARAWQDDRLGT